jgi:hypothetical protein
VNPEPSLAETVCGKLGSEPDLGAAGRTIRHKVMEQDVEKPGQRFETPARVCLVQESSDRKGKIVYYYFVYRQRPEGRFATLQCSTGSSSRSRSQ